MVNSQWKTRIVSFVFLLSSSSFVHSLSLDESGRYSLVVAIDEDTVQNDNLDYVKNIRAALYDLSELLNYTTDGKFFIQNFDILVPSHWDVEADEPSTNQYYEGADIKISHKFYLPQVENPNACGRPGHEITLPYGFFDSVDSGPYGRLGSALLTLFVRLRFGAWEEHGYPGDTSFPYFWKSMLKDEWEVNSCTDKPLAGEYRNVVDGSPCGQNSNPLYPPSSDCRFFPNENQEASSSLMSYHYLRNFDKFCDFVSHNREAPTPQNFYCKFKSVKEVIELSSDFKRVTQRPSTNTVPQIRVIKSMKTKPVLYILLDRGVTQAPNSILTKISKNMETLINQADLAASLIVGVGCFPGMNAGEPYSQLVPWSSLQSSTNVNLINQTLHNTLSTHAGFRNYGAALRDTVLEIKKMQHKAGAVILIVKSGPESNRGAIPPEYEVLIPLYDSNIRIYAVEIEGNSIQRGIALENISQKSGGKPLKLSSTTLNVDDLLRTYFTDLATSLKTAFPQKNLQLILREAVPSESVAPVVGISQGTTIVHAFAIPIAGDVTVGPFLDGALSYPEGTFLGPIPFTETEWMKNWDDPTASSRNGMYYVENSVFGELTVYTWNTLYYECADPNAECLVMFVMFAEAREVDKTYSIRVSTSAISGEVDLLQESSLNDVGSPFIVYAKVEENGTPLLPSPGLSVVATIYNEARTSVNTFELTDSGPTGMPLNDGIYSGSIMPAINTNTNFKIFVTVKYLIPTTTAQASYTVDYGTKSAHLQKSTGKLFPINQTGYMGCGSGYLGCWSKQPDSQFLVSAEVDGLISIVNPGNYVRYSYRITDLRWTPLPDFNVTLEWTAPFTLLKVDTNPNEQEIFSYNVRHSESLDRLLYDFNNCESLLTENPRPAGLPELRYWNFYQAGKKYFAVKAQRVPGQGEGSALLDSEMSNVISIEFQEKPEVTTTTLRPTATPPSTTTTTTAAPPPTTTPNTLPTTTATIPRTSVSRLSTTVPTTPRTTVVTKTTPPPPVITTEKLKHWYEEKEGIITLSVGGAAILLVITGGLGFLWFFKYRG